MMDVHKVALETVAALRPLLEAIARHDSRLLRQLRAAVGSYVLNIGEAERSDPGNARARWHTAAGSLSEVRAGLELALAFGYTAVEPTARADALLDRVAAMLWRLSRPRR